MILPLILILLCAVGSGYIAITLLLCYKVTIYIYNVHFQLLSVNVIVAIITVDVFIVYNSTVQNDDHKFCQLVISLGKCYCNVVSKLATGRHREIHIHSLTERLRVQNCQCVGC